MAIEFRCTQCNKLLRTSDDTAGKKAKCPECGTVLDVPQAQTPTGGTPFGVPPGQTPDPSGPFQPPTQPGFPPPGQPGPSPPSEEVILAKVKLPAIALVVVGSLGIFGCVLGMLVNLLVLAGTLDVNDFGGFQAAMPPATRAAINLGSGIIGLLLYILVVVGGVKMQKLESYGLAMAASIIAMLPCGCCCLIGLPFGIWSLVVLANADVKAAFRS